MFTFRGGSTAQVAQVHQPKFVLHGEMCCSFASRAHFIDWILAQETPIYLKPTTTMQGQLVVRISRAQSTYTFETSCPYTRSIIATFSRRASPLKSALEKLSALASEPFVPHPIQSTLHCAALHLAGGRNISRNEATCLINLLLDTPPKDLHRCCDWIAEHDIAPQRSYFRPTIEFSYVFGRSTRLVGSYGKVACGNAVAGNLARGARPTKTTEAFRLALPRLSAREREDVRARLETELPRKIHDFMAASSTLAPAIGDGSDHPLAQRVFRVDLRFPTNSSSAPQPQLVEIQCDLPDAPLGLRGLFQTDPGAYNAVYSHLVPHNDRIPCNDASFGG